ncbi:response regulator transcription factor [bacterium]|nr:response regulator transcription factor [bacterium]
MIADDHAMVRSGLRIFLLAFDDLMMVGEAGSGVETITLCKELHPDIVLMDMIMPGMDGIRATHEISARFPETKVIGLTSYFESNLIQEMLDAGAVSFLVKNVTAAELADAIRSTVQGQSTISPEIQEILRSPHASLTPPMHTPADYDLSPREVETLTCMAVGMSNAEIAEDMVISLSTVKYHVSNILMKLNASNRSEAVSQALRENLVDVSRKRKKEE